MEVNVNKRVHSIKGKYKSVVVRFSLFFENAILGLLYAEDRNCQKYIVSSRVFPLNIISMTYAQEKPLSCSPDIFQFHLEKLQSYW